MVAYRGAPRKIPASAGITEKEARMEAQQYILGIDAGSVAIGIVKLNRHKEVVASDYRFHHGDIEKTLARMLEEIGMADIGHCAATDSTPVQVAAQQRYNNQISVIEAAKYYSPRAEAVLAVGGEKFFLSRFDSQGHYAGSSMNTSCAAGTGSFLDQQASRLKMEDIRELSTTACKNEGDCPKIASRCAVFAKTDLIHAQQEGYQYGEISDGLCHGLAKNIVDTLFSSHNPPQRVVFCGGVSKNKAVADHIEALTSIALEIPPEGHLFGAIGAALIYIEEYNGNEPMHLDSIADLLLPRSKEKVYSHPPLELVLSDYPDFTSLERYEHGLQRDNPVEVDIYEPMDESISVFLGIDIGSTSTKAVVIDEQHRVLAGFYTRTAGRPLPALQQIFAAIEDLEEQRGIQLEVLQCATTGSGRKFIGKIVGADAIIDEITAHARAAASLDGAVDTIIEIGGQDAKFTTLLNGRVTSSTMNNVCAAGTGSFIEEQALRLGCSIDDYAERTAGVRAPMASDRCTVFMERDINHHLSEGFTVEEALASALHSVRENYLMKVATEKNIGEKIFFQGATAKNRSLVAAFEQRLNKPIMVSRYCHLTGALGAAFIASDEMRGFETSFKGFGLCHKDIPITFEVCELCTNHCKISVADTPSGKVAYGFLCGREYEDRHYVPNSKAFDLLKRRKKQRTSIVPVGKRSDVVIGLPAAVHMVEDIYFWQNFFALLGIRTISSSTRQNEVGPGKKLSRSEFCAPVSAMHGHVESLLAETDYVFLPYYLENKNKEARRQYCYYTQYLPGLIGTMGEEVRKRLLSPVIRYLYTSFHAKVQLYRMLNSVAGDIGFLEVSHSYDQALRTEEDYREKLQDLFRENTTAGDDVEVVFLGRPYSVLSPSMNGGIPQIFAEAGINGFFQDMIPYEEEDVAAISPLLKEVHWQHSATILEVAEVVARTPGLYPVYVTSFKCSPDSFTLEYFKSILEANKKPYLILELDEHDSSVGYETRVEAAARSFRNHHTQVHQKSLGLSPRLSLPDYRMLEPHFIDDLEGKNVVLPNWDRLTCGLLGATLEREGYAVYVMEESEASIKNSLKYNSGQCIPLNAIAEGFITTMRNNDLAPADTALWLNRATLACNIRLYPYHIQTLLQSQGYGEAAIYTGSMTFTDISLRAAQNCYFSYMFGGLLRRVACSIRPYERSAGQTDRILEEGLALLCRAFRGEESREEALEEVISRFQKIPIQRRQRPKVAIFGDLYVRDNRVMNQDLIRFIEMHGGEVVTTPYSEYVKMIAGTYFRKWFNEKKYFNVLSSKAILTAMVHLEKKYSRIFDRVLSDSLHSYDESPADILSRYNISVENTGESMDNILKVHYIHKHYSDVSLFVQASPSLCCASLITEAMKEEIEEKTGVPVVSVVYDGTAGAKNEGIVPYLKYGRRRKAEVQPLVCQN